VGLRAHRTAPLNLRQIVLLESTPNGLRDQWLPNLEQPVFKWIASDTLLYALKSLGSRWLHGASDKATWVGTNEPQAEAVRPSGYRLLGRCIGLEMQTCASEETKDRLEQGSTMTSINHLQRLADQLEQSARGGLGAQLSRHATELLLAIIHAIGETDETTRRPTAAYAFRVTAGDIEGRFEEVLARTSDISLAKAMFEEAVRQTPHRNVRLMKDFDVLEEIGQREALEIAPQGRIAF
jgi:hypothetical protein